MTYVNKLDSGGKCSKRSKKSVDRFDEVIESMGGKSEDGTLSEDINKHIDKHVKLGCREFTVDVKAAKSIQRGGDINIENVWVEFKNVNGKRGWLYGDQDFIAFETTPKKFIMVARKHLAELCEKLVDLETIVDNAGDCLYKGYQRRGRNDLISRIKMEDIEKLEHVVLERKK